MYWEMSLGLKTFDSLDQIYFRGEYSYVKGAIQIIRDTLGGGESGKCHQMPQIVSRDIFSKICNHIFEHWSVFLKGKRRASCWEN